MSTASAEGRAGKSGKAITFVSPRTTPNSTRSMHYAKVQIPRIPVPSESDVAQSKTRAVFEQVRGTIRPAALSSS